MSALSHETTIAAIRRDVERRGSVRASAEAHAISASHLNMILYGQRKPGPRVQRRYRAKPRARGRPGKLLTPGEMLGVLETMAADFGTCRLLARELNMGATSLCNILRGHRPVSDRVARGLGYRRVVRYERLPDEI